MKWRCPSCGNDNSPEKLKCICQEPRPTTIDLPNGMAHGACCVNNCPMPGAHSDSLRGGGPWWCLWHYRAQGDPVHTQRITDDLIANRPKITGVKANGERIGGRSN